LTALALAIEPVAVKYSATAAVGDSEYTILVAQVAAEHMFVAVAADYTAAEEVGPAGQAVRVGLELVAAVAVETDRASAEAVAACGFGEDSGPVPVVRKIDASAAEAQEDSRTVLGEVAAGAVMAAHPDSPVCRRLDPLLAWCR
jgi:hypothetical protein